MTNSSKRLYVLNEKELLAEEAMCVPPLSSSQGKEVGELAFADALKTTGQSDVKKDRSHITAICLSGGGQRSASFSLGVLQALAKEKILENSSYLSAVSGGSYTQSWLTRWRSEVAERQPWSQELLEEKPENFSSRQNDLDPIRRLRSYSNYLSPRTGFSKDSVTFAFSALRKFSYNLAAWLLIFLTFGALVRAVIASVAAAQTHVYPLLEKSPLRGLTSEASPTPLFVTPTKWTVESVRALLVDPVFYSTLLPPIIMTMLILLGWFYALVCLRSKPLQQEGVSRWSASIWSFASVWFVVFLLFGVIPEYLWDVATVQHGHGNLGFLSFALAASATLTAVSGMWTAVPKALQEQAKSLAEKLRAYTLELISLAMLIALSVASGYFVRWLADKIWFSLLSDKDWLEAQKNGLKAWTELGKEMGQLKGAKPEKVQEINERIDHHVDKLSDSFADITRVEIEAYGTDWVWFWVLFVVIGFFAFVFSELAGANRSSLHSVYSTRLTRAFLGTTRNNRPTPEGNEPDFSQDDDILLERIRFDQHTDPHKPKVVVKKKERQLYPLFPVVNMTLNIKGPRGNRQDWQERKGAPFIATPLHVGSELLKEEQTASDNETPATGYVSAEALGGQLSDAQMSLGRAMAISGAVASPNMGFYTRPIVSAAMAILNIRLGWWLRNPVQAQSDETRGWWPFQPSRNEPLTGVLYLFTEAFGFLSDKDRWLYLSDGGHFDNLGLYEMIRRECRQILVVDAGYDPNFEYSDLLSTVRKIRVDFGVNIKLPASLPGQEGEGKNKRYVIGEIQYGDSKDNNPKNGRLILLKPRLLPNDPPDLEQYKEQSRRGTSVFPHQTTLDQFFDETQFESYRMLGAVSAKKMIAELQTGVGLFTPEGTKFETHYPKPVPTDGGVADNTSNEDDPTSREPVPPNDEETTNNPAGSGGGSGSLANTVLATMQNMPTSDLLLRAVGAVAATTITVSVALDGTEAIKDVAAEATNAVTPGVSPESDTKAQSSTGDAAVLREVEAIREDLKTAQLSLDKLDELTRLEAIAIDLGLTRKELSEHANSPGRDQSEPKDYSSQLKDIETELDQIGPAIRALNLVSADKFDRELDSLRSVNDAQTNRLGELEGGRGQANGDINALQRQIDFLRLRLNESTQQTQ